MAIVMFGLNVGASVVPYITTLLWNVDGEKPIILIIVMALSMFIPLPLLQLAKYLSYRNNNNIEFHEKINIQNTLSYNAIEGLIEDNS